MAGLNIRNRLLISYLAVIVLGFGGLAWWLGQQSERTARADYVERLQSEMELVADALRQPLRDYAQGTVTDAQLELVLSPYEMQLGGSLAVWFTGRERDQSDNTARRRIALDEWPELRGAAMVDGVAVDERRDADGVARLYVGASVKADYPIALLQLSVPLAQFQGVLTERWQGLWMGVVAISAVTVLVALILATSITQPLDQLQQAAIRLSDGELSYRFAKLGQDEIGAVGQAFNHMAERLEQMVEEQRAFASNAAHELRTPLTTIQLRAERLLQFVELQGEAYQYLREIETEAHRLGHLVNGLRLLSQIDSGHLDRGDERIEMGRLVAALCQQFADEAAERGVKLDYVIPAVALYTPMRLIHATTIFRNLIENALKYNQRGGKVSWQMFKQGQQIYHEICDTGQGVAQSDLPHVFKRFYRADKARSREGTGLGLALAKSIIIAYGGQIVLESGGIGQGVCVRVWLPSVPEWE
jgi:signal transduction histidine kinase